MTETTTTATTHPTIVLCKNGERFDVTGPDTERGVEFDGGTIPWDDVAGFAAWSREHERYMTIPLDDHD